MHSEKRIPSDVYSKYEIGLRTLLRRLEEKFTASDPRYLEALTCQAEMVETARLNARSNLRYLEALTYQQRLGDNLATARQNGDNETLRSERAAIIVQLNHLTTITLGSDFNSLCPAEAPTVTWLKRYWWVIAAGIALIFLGAWLPGSPYLKPRFTIVASNTLIDDENAYELTDMLIWNRKAAEEEQYGMDIAFPIEIRPSYYGAQRLGRVIAIVSGDGAASKEIALWDDFTHEANTRHITMTLAELVTISGINDNSDPGINKLNPENYYFERASVRIQIAQVAQKSRPWYGETIAVRNAPWQEDARLVTRYGRREVDCYVRNLGGKGDFTIRYRLARLNDMDQYGTTVEAGNYPKTLVSLDTGQSYTATLPLPDNLGYGRYSIEVYAVKRQNYVTFTDARADWSNLSSLDTPWWFGGSPTQEFVFEIYTEPPIADLVTAERERLRNEAGFDLGVATGPVESVTSSRGTAGERQLFENGEVYVHKGQAYALYGPILEHYHRLDGLKNPDVGLPISATQTVTSALGTEAAMMTFEGPEGYPSVFYASWQATAGVWGWIASAYLNTYGGTQGWLGLPIADAWVHTDSITQKFEGGYMAWYYPWVDGERQYNDPPVAYPYLTSQGVVRHVDAALTWQNTGIVVKPGDAMRIVQVGGLWTHWENGIKYDANGQPLLGLQADTPLSTTISGALIGRIGENRPFAVGRWLELTASDTGNLYLAMNDNRYDDNKGFVTVEIVVEPAEER